MSNYYISSSSLLLLSSSSSSFSHPSPLILLLFLILSSPLLLFLLPSSLFSLPSSLFLERSRMKILASGFTCNVQFRSITFSFSNLPVLITNTGWRVNHLPELIAGIDTEWTSTTLLAYCRQFLKAHLRWL